MWCVWLCYLYFINIVFRVIFKALYSCLFNSSLLDLASCQFISLMPLQSSIVFTLSWHLITSVGRFLSSQHYYFHLSQCLKYLWMITTEWHQRFEIYIIQTSVYYFKLSELRPHRTENPKDGGIWGKLWTETRDANLKTSTSKEGTVFLAAAAAAAAKSLQSCPTLCDPIDGSPPGSPVPGILQARTLEWIAISFSNAWKWKVKVKSLSRVRFLVTPWTAAYQAPPSMGFSRQEYWSGVP